MTRLAAGDRAADFSLPTADGGTVALAEQRENAERGVVVYFYPRAATPGCTKEACDFRDSLDALQSAGYRVVGISPDPVGKLAKFAEKQSLTFPLAADEDHAVAAAWGAWGEKNNYGRVSRGLIRSTVVIDTEGTVELAKYNVKATGHVARLRRELGID